jgi:phosphinothricin acetyltransferase
MSVQFRKATRNDLPRIVEIYNSTIPGRLVTADIKPVSVGNREKWFEQHSPERPLWMVSDKEEIIGWLSFQDFYGRTAYHATVEISIYLDENQRGKGYGKAVLEKAFEICPSLEINNIIGFIFEHNLPSLRLFEKLGFEPWGRLPGVAVLDGIERTLVIMGKKVR